MEAYKVKIIIGLAEEHKFLELLQAFMFTTFKRDNNLMLARRLERERRS